MQKNNGKPFDVKELSYSDFYGFKQLEKEIDFELDQTGQKNKWM